MARAGVVWLWASAMVVSAIAGCDGGGGGEVEEQRCYVDPLSCIEPGDGYQFVAATIRMPTTVNEAMQLGLDLDRDDQQRPDNALGRVLATLASAAGGSFDLQASIDEQVADGGLLLLFHLQVSSLGTAPGAALWVHLGADPMPAPCVDPDDITTCGQHLDGSGTFAIDPASPPDAVLAGDIIAGTLDAGPGEITIELSLGDTSAVSIRLIGARVKVGVASDTLMSGRIGGAVTEQELNNSVLPAIVEVMAEPVAEYCMGTPETACCVEGSTGETIVDLFDDCSDTSTTCDCQVTLQEVRESDLIAALLSPDVDLLDADGLFNPRNDGVNDALSLGIGFTAVTAVFPFEPQLP